MRTSKPYRFSALLIVVLTTIAFTGRSLPSSAQGAAATATVENLLTFHTIQMVSKTNGWAVITIPDPKNNPDTIPGQTYSGTLGYIVHTQDGGQTWANVSPPLNSGSGSGGAYGCDCTDNALAGYFFLDDSHAWIATDDVGIPGNQVFNGISVWRTSYSGHSWQGGGYQGLNGPYVITSSFIDPAHGWMLIGNQPPINSSTQPALLYRTVDGGVTWQLVADDGQYPHSDDTGQSTTGPISSATTGVTPNYHTGMVFESTNKGWLTWSFPDPAIGGLLRTTDGGKTWKSVTMPHNLALADEQNACRASDLYVNAPGSITFLVFCQDGAYAANSQTFVYRTADDGKTWQSIPLPSTVVDLGGPAERTMFMLNPTTAWSIGCEPPANSSSCDTNPSGILSLFQTLDSDTTWTEIAPLPEALNPVMGADGNEVVPQFDFIDDQTGWAIGPSGGLLTTQDAGETWTPLTPKIGAAVSDATAGPTPNPGHAGSSCSTTTPPRLTIGQNAHITPGSPNNLRDSPSRTGRLIGTIPGGAEIQVVAGPVCDGQSVWWQVIYEGQTGWTVESDGKTYFIVPGQPLRLATKKR